MDLLVTTLAERYVDQIYRHIKEAEYTSALEKLNDMIRDISPGRRRDGTNLYSRYSQYKSDIRNNTIPREDAATEIASIRNAILDLAELIKTDQPTIRGEAENVLNVLKDATFEEDEQPDYPGSAEFVRSELDQIRAKTLGQYRNSLPAERTVVARMVDVRKRYGRGGFNLGPVTFALNLGEITGVVGMNASGKTTLVNILRGAIKHDSGHLEYPLLDVASRDWVAIKTQIGFASQRPDRWFGRLRWNLNYTAAAFGVTGKANTEMVDWYLNRYGLADYEDATWDRISGGYRTRFELVRALLVRPRLLILDEPLAFLDIVTQQIFLADVRSIASALDRPVSVIMTSQHLYEVEAIADRMVILDDGKCLFSGPIEK